MSKVPSTPLAILSACLLLAGCGPNDPKQARLMNQGPLSGVPGLEDCTYTKVDMPQMYLHVVRCPNSSTTTEWQSGKTRQRATTVTR